MRWLILTTALAACGGSGSDDSQAPTTGSTTATPTIDGCVATGVAGEVITLTTRDNVDLEADLYTGIDGKPGIVLLHMVPPSNTRADYPANFIKKLTCHGWSVVNVDRRGAGGSDGTPEDSYFGPGGAWDVEAAVEALTDA